MTAMSPQRIDIPHPRRQQARCSGAADGAKHGGFCAARTAREARATKLPQRPDRSILSEAIPLFFIGRNSDGFWVAREADGRVGGTFLLKRSALQFARRNAEPDGCATMFVSERFELDIANQGNCLVAQLAAAKRIIMNLASISVVGKAVAIGRKLVGQFKRAHSEMRKHRAAIERELYQNRYRLSSKNDDDRPIVR